jgi:hypothetical protein
MTPATSYTEVEKKIQISQHRSGVHGAPAAAPSPLSPSLKSDLVDLMIHPAMLSSES